MKEAIVKQLRTLYPAIEPMDPKNPKNIVEERQLSQMQLYEEDDSRPMICGEFSNWKPVRMLRIDEFSLSLDPEMSKANRSMFDVLADKGRIASEAQVHRDFDKLDSDDQRAYSHFKEETMDFHNNHWFETLTEEILYKKPFMSNGDHLNTVEHPYEEQLYVFPCFLRPGKQRYVVIQEDELANQTTEQVPMPDDHFSYFIHKCIVENRTENVAPFSKPMKIIKK
mmetsp:Transcript_32855/g.50221  ORF Transcript_32855/g.50221 Transcript_32855/m.50221 type:complete len:225 (+) Transcript_32855:5970-6644(+)